MGGSAFLIFGEIEVHLLAPKPVKKNLVDRLLNRQRLIEPERTQMGKTLLTEIPPGGLVDLKKEFFHYLHEKMPSPRDAAKHIFDYFKMDITTVYLRGEKLEDKSDTDWYVQLSFSGCAGMAEVSASIAVHWAAIWFRSNFENLNKYYFDPFGFHPKEDRQDCYIGQFIPLPNGGYTEYHTERQGILFEDGERQTHFEIDAAILESEADGGIDLLSRLESSYAALLADGKCRCELCSPGFVSSV